MICGDFVFFKSLLFRSLPLEIGRCSYVIEKEKLPKGLVGCAFFFFFINTIIYHQI